MLKFHIRYRTYKENSTNMPELESNPIIPFQNTLSENKTWTKDARKIKMKNFQQTLSHHRRPRPSRWGTSSSGSPRRCTPRPAGTPGRTAWLPWPPPSPAPPAPLPTAAEATPPERSCWRPGGLSGALTLGLQAAFPALAWRLSEGPLEAARRSTSWRDARASLDFIPSTFLLTHVRFLSTSFL